ncbi:MAG TPA: carboxypeptidase regulatory-like domain-containing protein [Bryobacteraceae bacterium]|nr:carboxypeptidase regulatory-like domain-containing protein [Bryobacteraceae bacterium]
MAIAIAVTLIIKLRPHSLTLTGVVIAQDADPRKQVPIGDVKITASDGVQSAATQSDASGLFRVKLTNSGWRDRTVTLTFQHSDYRMTEITPSAKQETDRELYVVRLPPNVPLAVTPANFHQTTIKDVRVRYAEKTSNNVNVGSTAKTFTVDNIANVPCHDRPPCSPDGHWKASQGGVTIDAGAGQEFDNARVSCIAGPCPFTRIVSGTAPHPGRTATVQVINWSDPVTFLVEAEVTRIMPSDAIRQAYPAIFGRSMSFTLPATAQGPSLQANLDGSDIVFPLGPALQLSWADCTLQVAPDKTKLYLCELKSGFQFSN